MAPTLETYQQIRNRVLVSLRGNSIGGRFFRGAAWSLFGMAAAQALVLLAAVVAARVLGREVFGQLGIINSTIGMLSLFGTMGLGATANKYVAESRSLDPERAGRIIGLSSTVAWMSGGLMTVALFFGAPFLADHVMKAPQLAPALRLASALLVIGSVSTSQTGAMAGLEAFQRLAGINIARAACSGILMIAGLWAAGLEGAVAGQVLAGGLIMVAGAVLLRGECKRAGVRINRSNLFAERAVLWGFSIPAFLCGAMANPILWVGQIILANGKNGYGELGLFTAANQWQTAVLFLPLVLAQPLLPMLSNMRNHADREQYLKLFRKALLLSAALAMAVAGVVMTGSGLILKAYGGGFGAARAALIVLMVAAVIQSATMIMSQSVISFGRMWGLFGFACIWGAIFLGGAVTLVPRYGAVGLAAASAAAYALQFVIVGLYSRRVLANDLPSMAAPGSSASSHWGKWRSQIMRVVTGAMLVLLCCLAEDRLYAEEPLPVPQKSTNAKRPRPANMVFPDTGLTSYPSGVIGPNLMVNPGFETVANGQETGWNASGGWGHSAFTPDCTVAHSGSCSIKYSNTGGLATQGINLKAGIYQFSGWIKMDALAATKGSGVRLCLIYLGAGVCTNNVKGTADWQQFSFTKIVIPSDLSATLRLEAYGTPDGFAWFDDIVLQREQFPLSAFLLYPNYRGLLYDDQSQTVQVNVQVDPPAGMTLDNYQVNGSVTDEASGATVLQASFPAAANLTAPLDFSALLTGRTYRVAFRLVPLSGSDPTVYQYPAYRIFKITAAARQSMTMSVDAQNRFLASGTPTFLLGVYDAGMGWTNQEDGWTNQFTSLRRLFELPINFYLNYWYGQAPNEGWLPMMNVLQSHGIYTITNANCGADKTIEGYYGPGNNYWFVAASDSTVQQRATHPAFAGFYTADECYSYLAGNVFGQYQRIKTLNPGGITVGTLLGDPGLPLWRDSLDVLATDPYPMYGAEPAGGYPLSQVSTWTRAAVNAVQGSRPVVSVLQFFKFTSLGRWPTQSELRNMSYMAIADGANGLLYWSLGANALAYICDGSTAYYSPAGSGSWCQAKIDNFTNLKNVLTELNGLQSVLAAPDSNSTLTGNDTPGVHTRVKAYNGKFYLIASNTTPQPVTARFTFSPHVRDVLAYGEATRSLLVTTSSFQDDFGPYAAHVYKIQVFDM